MGNIGSSGLKSYVSSMIEDNGGMGNDEIASYYAFGLRGVQSSKLLPLEEGKITMVEGRAFTEEEVTKGKAVTLISKELADLNQLSVGDTATFTNYSKMKQKQYICDIMYLWHIH